jgi:Flp pilus assembly protein TadD
MTMRTLLFPATLLLLAGCAGPTSQPVVSDRSVDRVFDAALHADMPDVALRVATEQVERNPRDVSALVRQAEAYHALGRDVAAEAAYRHALAISPSDARGQIGLGSLQLHRDPAAAETAFRQVIAQEPQNPQALTGLGVARDLQGDHTAAQSAYRAALQVQPDLRAAQVDLGLSFALSGKTADALALLQPLAGEPQATRKERDNLALALSAAGRADEARRILGEEMSDDDASRTLASYRHLF